MFSRPVARLLLLATIALIVEGTDAHACTCGPERPACAAYRNLAAMFSGRVISITPAPAGSAASLSGVTSSTISGTRRGTLEIRFALEQPGYGTTGSEAVLYSDPQDGVNCGYSFTVGRRYVVRAYAGAGGALSTNMCAGTKPVEEAADDLAFLEALRGPSRGVRLLGLVYRGDDYRLLRVTDIGRNGVAGARVVVRGEGLTREQVTGADGRYEIAGLPPGTYRLSMVPPRGVAPPGPPLHRNYHVTPGPFTVTLKRPFECSEQWFQVWTDSRVAGVLRTPAGRPAVDEEVHLVPVGTGTGTAPVMFVPTQTDGRGQYEFGFVPPGRYHVGLNLDRPPSELALDRRLYHPGVTERTRATVITVEEGSRIRLPAFSAVAAPTVRTIVGTVVWQDGTPAADAMVTLTGAAPEPVALDLSGGFRLTLPYGAKYILSASGRRSVNGRVMAGTSTGVTIDRDHRDQNVKLVLR